MFNVAVDRPGGPWMYLGENVPTRAEAQKWADAYNRKYDGKPFPNGKGYYPKGKARAVAIN